MQFKKGLRLIIRFLLADKKGFYIPKKKKKSKAEVCPSYLILDCWTWKRRVTLGVQEFTPRSQIANTGSAKWSLGQSKRRQKEQERSTGHLAGLFPRPLTWANSHRTPALPLRVPTL